MILDITKADIEFEKFVALLREVIDDGHGEVNYRIVIRDKKIDLVAITKMNTYKPKNATINI